MWPWGHLGVGYVLWSVWCRARGESAPTTLEFWLVAVATQLPDLVDKPLAWSLGVLPSGRSLAHSLFAAVAVTAVAASLGRRYGHRRLSACFALGYASHLAADAVPLVLAGETAYLGFLLWPVVASPYRERGRSLLGEFGQVTQLDVVSPYALPVVCFGVLWAADGFPGWPSRLR